MKYLIALNLPLQVGVLSGAWTIKAGTQVISEQELRNLFLAQVAA